jgi:WD40-like Beta Propeller Repeat
METTPGRLCISGLTLLVAASVSPAGAQVVGHDAVKSSITVIGVDGTAKQVIHMSPRRFGAPNWSPNGTYLLLNAGGKLWRLSVSGGEPKELPAELPGWVDINHGFSPDGKTMAVTAGGPIFLLPVAGGAPRRVTDNAPSYFLGWSPNGRTLVYTANRGANYDIFAIDARGGPERRLTTHPGFDDSPDYSPDGKWIYFNSDRVKGFDIWRMPAAGAGAGDAKAERVTSDERDDWFPHTSPDGKSLIFLSYAAGTAGHPSDHDVLIRRMPVPGTRVGSAKIEDVVRFIGGHGSIGSRPFSPDGRRFAYISYQPPPPTLRVVFFTPADLEPPPGVKHRLTQVADAAERFFVTWMKHWKYPPANEHIFRRDRDGSVEILFVKGDHPVSSGRYQKPNFTPEVLKKVTQQFQIAGDRHIWWIFTYLGEPPRRIDNYLGGGTSQGGGACTVNYSTIPGEIRPDLGLGTAFHEQWTLKGCIHELGHAFGLPHDGPIPGNGLGVPLMGPNFDVYAARKQPDPDKVYLSEASAAMLWKHAIFTGTDKDRLLETTVKITDYRASYSRAQNRVTLTGKLTSDPKAHSVVVLDDIGTPRDPYWHRGYVSRVSADGNFHVVIGAPAPTDGHYRILFCFDNGAISGAVSSNPDEYDAIVKSYRCRDGRYVFGD